MVNAHILPDSRLKDHEWGTVEIDWDVGGRTVKVPCSPVYCASCGKMFGYVPKDNTSFAFWLCNKCFETFGNVVGTYAVPEDEFNRAVQYEMQNRYGKDLSVEEIVYLEDRGQLSKELELLVKESPYPIPSRQG